MSPSAHATLYQAYGKELSELLDIVLAGEVITDRAAAERLVRSIGALVRLHQQHQLDEHGRWALCWPLPRRWWRPWPQRSTCTVHTTLSFYLRQPANFVLLTLTEKSGASPNIQGAP